jgi:hypothetical protein
MPKAFDIEGAHKAGYSDNEIMLYLAGQNKFDLERARKAGYKDQEIIDYLANPVDLPSLPSPAVPKPPANWQQLSKREAPLAPPPFPAAPKPPAGWQIGALPRSPARFGAGTRAPERKAESPKPTAHSGTAAPPASATATSAAVTKPRLTDRPAMIDRIFQVIKQVETGGDPQSIAMRQNNPGNLRQWGKLPVVGGFVRFPNMAKGVEAAKRQIALNISRGLTLNEFFGGKGLYRGWAPARDQNKPKVYAAKVAEALGINPDTPLNQPGQAYAFGTR